MIASLKRERARKIRGRKKRKILRESKKYRVRVIDGKKQIDKQKKEKGEGKRKKENL